MTMPSRPLQSVRKFYFLDYFYVLLRSAEKHSSADGVFAAFRALKQEFRLGESKYKKLTVDAEPTRRQQDRYRYTFRQVLEESKDYHLISESEGGNIAITQKGADLLLLHENRGPREFNLELFRLMEGRYFAFKTLVQFLYDANPQRSGVVVFPHYSPRELGFQKSKMKTTADIHKYAENLSRRLEDDVRHHTHKRHSLVGQNKRILEALVASDLLSNNPRDPFDPKKYNVITKRFRDFWITYFLRDLYRFKHPMSTFDIWVYRANQLGIVHATESHPRIHGKLVFPTAVLADGVRSQDFQKVFAYRDGRHLYIHEPQGLKSQERFVDALVKAYSIIRRTCPTYFVNLAAIREIVCLHLKISAAAFEDELDRIHRLNIAGKLPVKISLEVDRLPEETSAMYLKQEPVMVGGSYRNIIAIDATKGEEP